MKRKALVLALALGAAACTSAQTRPEPRSSRSSSDAVIELPPLPNVGLAAMWSREGGEIGVSFVSLEGRVIATVPGATLGPTDAPGLITLVRGDEHWLLDANANQLRRVSALRAWNLVRAVPESRIANPPGTSGEWIWVRESPDGTQMLGQFLQEVTECGKPIAMLGSSSSPTLEPITGQPLERAQSSVALGWVTSRHVVVSVEQTCGSGERRFADGVYLFDANGAEERLRLPEGSYRFQMWTPSDGETTS